MLTPEQLSQCVKLLKQNSFTQYLSSTEFKPEIKEKGGSIKATKSYERSITP